MSAASTIRDYYEALRRGEPLPPYFAGDEATGEPESPTRRGDESETADRNGDARIVKYGIGERLVGYEAIAAGLREQTRTTADWSVESHALRVTERPEHAWFSDEVSMAWTDLDADRERAFETRWSGTLERRDGAWRFVGMHVSVSHRIGADDGSETEDHAGARSDDGDSTDATRPGGPGRA